MNSYTEQEILLAASPFVDLFLYDIKDTDSLRHQHYTGMTNEKILGNLLFLNEINAKIRLQCILVSGINTNETHYENIAKLALQIKNLESVELIPYHAYAGTKATFIGKEDNGRKEWIPEAKEFKDAKNILKNHGIRMI